MIKGIFRYWLYHPHKFSIENLCVREIVFTKHPTPPVNNSFMSNYRHKARNINMNNLNATHKKASLLLKSYFASSSSKSSAILMSTPVFSTKSISNHTQFTIKPSTHVVIRLYYYINSAKININSINLGIAINQLYSNQGKVTVELQIVRQYQPYMNASILAQYLAINASKYGFHRIMTLLLNALPYANPEYRSITPSLSGSTSGIKVQLSGLLTSQRNPARKTVYTASAGTFYAPSTNEGKNTVIDYASSVSKSRVGAFNVKVWLCSTTS